MSTRFQITFDCINPELLAAFWAGVLGYKMQDPPQGYTSWQSFLKSLGVPEENRNDANAIVDPEGLGPRVYFQRVSEKKTIKNRVHLDIHVNANADVPLQDRKSNIYSESKRLIRLGASTLRTVEERGEFWIVMLDPEGNEFCLQ